MEVPAQVTLGANRGTTVSIAMATYNGTAHLEEQLQSFVDQSAHPNELVVSDDRSTDDTVAILRSFAGQAPFPVRIIENKENLGFSRNFELAISACSGSIIFISDQDDRWYPNKIESVVTRLQTTGALALIHDEHIYDEARDIQYERSFFENARALRFDDRELLSGNCTAIRRELLDILTPFPAGMNYDYWIGWVADILGVREVLPVPLQLYRRHGRASLSKRSETRTETCPSRR